jgi:M6 family metalloprotease-like protein
MGHYYAELSWNPAIMSGNRVAGWFRMPHPRRRYIEGTAVDYGALVHDCTGAAADKVHLPDYFGINLQFSGALTVRQTPPYDTLSFGGSWTLVNDGQARQYGVTWISRGHATNYVVYAHEMGHALGWPHSSMRRDQEYDSPWDVMSVGYLNFTREFGWLSIHTIAPHKDARGWIPASRHWLPAAGIEEEGVLVRTALPPASGYLAARLPLDPSTFYTVESRRLAGYDTPLPAEAVVIHQVVNGRAYAVDIGGDPQPNGLGAALRPGMTFTDSVHGISVEGLSEDEEGFRLRIRRGWLLGLTVGGAGRVVDASRAIDCEAECRQVYGERGATVTLSAEPAAGSSLLGWGGACSGTGECQLAMHGDRRVTALFDDGTTLIPSDSLRPPAVMGAPYQDRLDLTGSAGSWVWSVVAGALPPGIQLEADSGELHGIPEAAGVFHFTAAAHSISGAALRPLAIQVSQPSLSLDEVLDQLLGAGKLMVDELRFLDLQGNRNGRFDLGDVRAWLANRDATTLEPGGDR